MQVLIFNGCPAASQHSTGNQLSAYLKDKLQEKGVGVSYFPIGEAHIPFFDQQLSSGPIAAQLMCELFLQADLHIWLTPLYHGSLTGAMKNCLDWLELTAKIHKPYLTDKVVGLVCWADGMQALQGINAMDAVAKALRAWVLPFSVPIARQQLYDPTSHELSAYYTSRLDRMIQLLIDLQ